VAPAREGRAVMSPSFSWGLVGASDIAATRVIPAMRALGHTVDFVYSRSIARATEFASQHDIELGTDDLMVALASSVDGVYVSSENHLHRPQTLAAIAAGKHVLCEKPLAVSVSDAESMVDAADAAGLLLAVNHHLPYSPVHAKLRELANGGAIGQVLSARVGHAVMLPERLRGWRTEDPAGGGAVLDITTHDASVLNLLLGRARKVSAIGVKQGPWAGDVPDAVMTVIEYARDGDAIIAQTHDAFTVAYGGTSLTLHGTAGTLIAENAMTQDSVGTLTLVTDEGREEIELELGQNLYETILAAFVGATRGAGTPTTTGREGVETLRVALAALESMSTGTTIVLD